MRRLIGVVYWSNVIASIPASIAGLWFGLNVIFAQDDWLIGLMTCTQVAVGWWFLYGYYLALFKNDTPVSWKMFWGGSTVVNMGFAVLWIILSFQSDNGASAVLLGGWPFGIAFISAAVLRKSDYDTISTS
jgi:hypothetical protein